MFLFGFSQVRCMVVFACVYLCLCLCLCVCECVLLLCSESWVSENIVSETISCCVSRSYGFHLITLNGTAWKLVTCRYRNG